MPRTMEEEAVDRKTLGGRGKEEINKYKSAEYFLCIGTKA